MENSGKPYQCEKIKSEHLVFEKRIQFNKAHSSTKVVLRTARISDASGIAAVHVHSWRSTYTGLLPDEFLQSLSTEKRQAIWEGVIQNIERKSTTQYLGVAEDENQKIIGFISGGKERSNHPDFDSELYAIYLEKNEQRRGLGTQLTQELTKWLLSQGYKKMLLWVLDKNPSRQFYERIGAKLLKDTKKVQLGGRDCLEVAYGYELLSNS